MKRRIISALICVVMCLTLIPLTTFPVSAETERLLFSCTFDDEEVESKYWAPNGSAADIEWFTAPNAGHGDDTALRVTNNGTTFNSAENAVRLTLPEPLAPGGVYRVVAWCFAALDENPGKTVLTGPGFVINDDYAGAQGAVKFPPDFGTLPFDEWKAIDVTLPVLTQAINTLDFRIVINDAPKHPDVWYWDGIEIYQVGEVEDIRIPEWDLQLPSLAEAFKGHFPVGNIMESSSRWMSEHEEMFLRYYNAATVENSMKPLYIAPNANTLNFVSADTAVEWAENNGIALHGHTLVWHSQSPEWLTYDENRNVLTRAEAKANLERFITAYAGRYVGRVASWDVVNEAFNNSISPNTDWKSVLRRGTSAEMSSAWYAAYSNGIDTDAGEAPYDYIYDAFVFARLAAPDAVLFYNDFNEEEPGKRNAIADMADYFNNKWKDDARNTQPDRKLIEGIGMQAHYWVSTLDPNDVEDSIKRFIESGLRIRITELDIPMGSWSNQREVGLEVTDAELEEQASLFRDLFRIFVRHSEHIDAVTIWGLADSHSWRARGLPLLFDEFYEAKPAFWAVLETAPEAPPEATPVPVPPEAPQTPAETGEPPLHEANGPDDGGGFPWWILIVVSLALGVTVGVVYVKLRKGR